MNFFLKKVFLLFITYLITVYSFASSCSITGTVYASSSPCSSSVDTIFVNDTLIINAALSYSYNVIVIVDGGFINWTSNSDFTLNANSSIYIVNGGKLGPTSGGACNSQKTITFGSYTIASCNGGGQGIPHSFSDVNNAGGANSSGVLSVNISNFNCKQDGKDVVVKWSTISEKNNSHFEIQCLINDSFYSAGEVSGAGNSDHLREYSFTHRNSNCRFYRLVQVDFNGNKWHSKIISTGATSADITGWKIHPNPCSPGEELKLDHEYTNSDLSYRIISKEGSELTSGVLVDGNRSLSTLGLPNGMIILELKLADDQLVYLKVLLL